ncbi:hypothetical protein DYE50_05875 [Treponema ruminis]|nr:hypothetical protein DYE50_05875 [Treponema ruminis]
MVLSTFITLTDGTFDAGNYGVFFKEEGLARPAFHRQKMHLVGKVILIGFFYSIIKRINLEA